MCVWNTSHVNEDECHFKPFQAHPSRIPSCDRAKSNPAPYKTLDALRCLTKLVNFTGTGVVFGLDQVQKRATRLVNRLKGLLKGSRGEGRPLGGQLWAGSLMWWATPLSQMLPLQQYFGTRPNPDLVSAGKERAGFKMRHLHYCDRYKRISTSEGVSRGNPSPTT